MSCDPLECLYEALTKPTMAVPRGGAVIGLAFNASYRAAQDGTLPTIPAGKRKRVPSELLLRMIGLDSYEARAAALQRIRDEREAQQSTRPLKTAAQAA